MRLYGLNHFKLPSPEIQLRTDLITGIMSAPEPTKSIVLGINADMRLAVLGEPDLNIGGIEAGSRTEFHGIPISVDVTMDANAYELRDAQGKVIGKGKVQS